MKRFKSIVVAVDVASSDRLVVDSKEHLSAASRSALDKASWVAKTNGGALHVITSLDVDPRAERLIRAEMASGADALLGVSRERLDEIVEPLRADGLHVTTGVAFGRASTAVLDDVAKHGRDLVVVGTRERGSIARHVLGSTSLQLLRRCPAAVWIARDAPHGRIGVIVAPIDVGGMAPKILRVASSLAVAFSARLIVVHAVDAWTERLARSGAVSTAEVKRVTDACYRDAQVALDSLVETYCDGSVDVETRLQTADASDVILDTAASTVADLVVMSSVVQSAVARVFLGRTADKVLPQLTTSLLVLKPGERR